MGQYDAPSGPPPNYSSHPAPAGGEAANYYGDSTPPRPKTATTLLNKAMHLPLPTQAEDSCHRNYKATHLSRATHLKEQQGYPPQGYQQQQQHSSGAGGGICAGVLSALACCCCLDILF
ncbi:unnamed protein product [Aureobasidium pullulans]|nr:unnamed protein product [Aureobasidium pullulans]